MNKDKKELKKDFLFTHFSLFPFSSLIKTNIIQNIQKKKNKQGKVKERKIKQKKELFPLEVQSHSLDVGAAGRPSDIAPPLEDKGIWDAFGSLLFPSRIPTEA